MEEPAAQPQPETEQEALRGASPSALSHNDDGEEVVSAETNTPLTCDAAAQTEAPAADAAAVAAQLRSPGLATFLRRAAPRCEAALQQNELADPLLDALAALADEEAGDAGAPGGTHTGTASSAAGLVERQSFSDLLHSKGHPLAAACFHPARRGVVAVAVGGGSNAPAAGLPAGPVAQHAQPGCILVWNHSDAIHPEAVLHAPAQVTALAWHPTQQHWLAAGLCTGQVVLFNLQQTPSLAGGGAAAASSSGRTAEAGPNGQAAEGGQEGSSHTADVMPLHLSMPEASHQAAVSDLHWLPGVALSRDGHLEAAAAHGEGGGAAGSADAVDGCTLFATTAADGALLCWDMCISARHRKQAAKGGRPVGLGMAVGVGAPALQASCAALLPLCMSCTDPHCPALMQRTSSRTGSRPWPWLLPAPPSSRCWPPGSVWMPAALATAAPPALWSETWLERWWWWMRLATAWSDGCVPVPSAFPALHLMKQGAWRCVPWHKFAPLYAPLVQCLYWYPCRTHSCPATATAQGDKEWEHNTLHGAAGRAGRILALQPSPFFPDVLLAVCDCGFAVWRLQRKRSSGSGADGTETGGVAEGGRGEGAGTAGGQNSEALLPIFESRFPDALYSCGSWSPSKPGGRGGAMQRKLAGRVTAEALEGYA